MIETVSAGRRYRSTWALRDATLSVPDGAIVALVGPNGAGKTTLLHLLAGLSRPTEGTVRVLGEDPARVRALRRIGFVAQSAPLYESLTVAQTLMLGARMNPGWQGEVAQDRITELAIPADRKCGQLSGGQRSQVALALALGKDPDLLLLDEPLASLDPLARSEFVDSVLAVARREHTTIVLSSHLVTDLERFCSHLLIVAGGRVQLFDSVDALVASHRVMDEASSVGLEVIGAARERDRVVVHAAPGRPGPDLGPPGGPASVEELAIAYLSRAATPAQVAS